MTSVFHLINNKYSSLSRSERTVAEYILQNPAAVMLLSMRGLAEKINLSDNTVLRFCRTCGFSGYLDFKTALLPQVVTENGSIYKQVDTRDRFTLQREKISKNLSTTIGETYGNTREEEITLVARRIAASQHTYLVGLAPSVGVARIFADSLRVIGVPSSPLADRIEIERTCLGMRSGSVLIGLTHSWDLRRRDFHPQVQQLASLHSPNPLPICRRLRYTPSALSGWVKNRPAFWLTFRPARAPPLLVRMNPWCQRRGPARR